MTSAIDRTARFPLGGSVRLADLAVDPYPILARLRAEEPVSWVEDARMWFVTRRADVLTALRDPTTFRTDSPRSTIRDTFGEQMLSAEGEQHRRYKSACNPPFNARAVQAQALPLCRQKLTSLTKAVSGQHRIELRSSVASPIAVFMIATVLGLPEQLHGSIRGWYDDFAAALANFAWDPAVRATGRATAEHFRQAVMPVVRTIEHTANPSLLAVLSHPSPHRLKDEEIVANTLIVMFGGIETTESTILNVLWAMLTQPGVLDAVRAERALIPKVIEEALRWEPAVQSCTRYVATETELAGITIPAGDTVQCMIGAANRDPSHFPDPDRFDLHRANSGDHISFGSGKHFCLGAALARVEVQATVDVLLDSFPALRADPDRPSRPHGYEFRAPPELWVVV